MRSTLAPIAASEIGGARLIALAETDSTMDEVHQLAARGEGGGLVVVADRQRAGRGRSGNAWSSEAGAGLWFTLLERPTALRDPGVLSLRVGLAIAQALDEFADETVGVKWPNDLYLSTGKLAGVLVETRWREGTVEWVAIGVGINLAVPVANDDSALRRGRLRDGTTRERLLRAILPRLRSVMVAAGALTPSELAEWTRRDVARGASVVAPVEGEVEGIDANGALLVRSARGVERVTSGSLHFRDPEWWTTPHES